MDKNLKIELVQKFMKICDKYEKQEEKLLEVIGNIESPYIQSVDMFNDFAIDCLAKLICGDDSILLDRFFWFMFDNLRGTMNKQVIIDGKEKNLSTIDDLFLFLDGNEVKYTGLFTSDN